MVQRTEKNRGFTLIELLVGLVIFSLLIGAVTNMFFSSIASQRRILAEQQLVSQTLFLQEYMSRTLRQANKELVFPALCLTEVGTGYNYEITHSGQGIKILNRQDECQNFFLQDGRIVESIDGFEQFLSPDELEVVAMNFEILGESQLDDIQPRVSFFLNLRSKGGKPENQIDLQTQTTLSQRRIDVEQ